VGLAQVLDEINPSVDVVQTPPSSGGGLFLQGGCMKIDASPWPLVVITLPPILTPDTIEGMRVFSEGAFRRGQRYATAVDATRVEAAPDAMFRRQLVDMMNAPSWREGSARCVVGTSVVVTSAVVRAASTAINWLYASPHPVHYAADLPAAVDWCVARLQETGVNANAAMRGFHASLMATRVSVASSR
jgi:hypothetical protein